MGLYKLNKGYYIPSSAIRYYPNLKYAVDLPELKVEYEEIYSLELSDKCKNKKDMFFQPAGFASEKLIKAMLKAKNVEDSSFAKENFKKLEYLGKFSYKPVDYEIPVIENENGTLEAVREEDKEFVEEMNRTMLCIKSELPPLVKFIQNNIFNSEQILTQETVICDELHAFGYTDFSNNNACLEMKFSDSLMDDYYFTKYHPSINKHKYQFYFLSKNRPTYLLIGGHSRFIVLKLKFYVGKESVREAITVNRHYETRIVVQYSWDGKKIKEFVSAVEAGRELGVGENAIRDNCNGRTQLTKGFQFKYKDSKKVIGKVVIEHRGGHKNITKRITKHVLQYTTNGVFVKEFPSMKEAQQETGTLASKISMVCNGQRNKAGGFVWKFKEDKEN